MYLDTNHQYETTRKELIAASRKVRSGGFIAGHDYVTGNFTDGIRYGVIPAVNEFCNSEGWSLRYLTNEPDRHLSFAIQKPVLR